MEPFYEIQHTPSGSVRVVRVERVGSNTHRTEVARYSSPLTAAKICRELNSHASEELPS